jgi:putative peptidoglycan lipid II flippase
MVKKITNVLHQKNSVTGASIILIITLFLSNVLGVVRDHYLTQKIPTDLLSTYYAAFNIPDLIFNVLILGAMASAFIPVFTTLISQKKDKEAWMVAVSIINIAIILLVALSIIFYFIMPYIAPIIVPGFSGDNQLLMIRLARIMLISPILFGVSYIFGGILNSFKRFFVYSLSPLVYNLTIILGTIYFADKYSVIGVAYAVVVGAFLHLLIQIPVALKLGFRWQLRINLHHWGVRRIGILMVPRSLALGANQIMVLIFTAIASSIGGYSIAAYNLANNIQTMPTVVFGTAFATAVFPTLSEAVSKKENNVFSSQIERITRVILFFLVPITVMVILLRTEIVRLILGSGFFGWEQTVATANILGFFSLSLVFNGLTPLFARSFYALHNTRTPMILTMINVVISIVVGKILSINMGVSGLALGFTIGSAVSAVIYYIMLRKYTESKHEKKLIIYIIKILFAALLTAIAIQECKILIGLAVDMQRFWGVLIKTLVSLGIGTGVYLLCCWIFGLEEINAVKYALVKFNGKGINNDTDTTR